MNKLFQKSPAFLQSAMISVFNFIEYRKRYGGKYSRFKKMFKKNEKLDFEKLLENQNERFLDLVKYAKTESTFYGQKYAAIPEISDIKDISKLPIISKEELRKNIEAVYTVPKSESIVSKTGGTTGKSLEVLFTHENMQERFALLDNFRNQFGYKLGRPTAWFSGKSILTKKDLKNNIFWKTDFYHKVRYYSTFHIKNENLKIYIENLIQFKPEYLVGFPSTIHEIAKYGLENSIAFPTNVVKAIFPTAESVTPHMKNTIETFFNTKVYDQYASSEGAPFIFECKNKNLHIEMQSGVFEVLDEKNNPAKEGRLVVTSFTTYGTPLIRYDIEDSIILNDSAFSCYCGNNNPVVKKILGRIDDYVYSPETGKINLGNVSNTLKDVRGIVKFQAIQDSLNSIEIKIVIDAEKFTSHDKKMFLLNWRDRVGQTMKISIEVVEEIPVEKSGKYRMVKNNIKHLIP